MALAPAGHVQAADCTPQSATITFQADDDFSFWLNGVSIVANVHDSGNPTFAPVPIPISAFNPPGTPNYYAYAISNTTAALIGGDWLISITCQGGSVTYMSSSDTTLTEYDDMQGTSPPSMEAGVNWYDSTWPDTLNQFTDPIVYGAINWFNPGPLTNPETGDPLPVLSYSANGDQCGLAGCVAQTLYYRESVVIPTPAPTSTPTLTSTPYPPGCGPPVYVGGKNLLQGQPGNGSVNQSYTYTVPSTVSDALVLVEVEEQSSGEDVSSMTLTPFGESAVPVPLWESQSIPAGASASGTWAIYAMTTASLPAGAATLNVTFNNTDNSNGIIEIYEISNALSMPSTIGVSSLATQAGSGNTVFTRTSPPLDGTGSLLMDFMVNNQNIESEGLVGTGTGQSPALNDSASGYATWSDYVTAGAAGATQSMSYDWPSPSGQTLASWLVEIKANACASATPTPTFTPVISDTYSDSPTETSTFTDSPTATASPTQTDTPSETSSFTQSYTSTDSPTPTDTASATPTFTSTLTPTPSFTSTQSYTSTMTQTFSSTQTDTDTPSATPTFTPSFTFTLTDTPTATPTLTNTYTDTATFTDSPTYTDSPTITETFTASPTSIPAPVNLDVSVYNSAGEMVDVLYQGGAENIPSDESIGSNPVLAGVQGVQLTLNTELENGAVALTWMGTNNNGQLVAGGAYYIQLTYKNTFGQTTSFTEPVQVISTGSGDTVSIYNSAGELVWTAPLASDGTVVTGSVTLSSDVVLMAMNSKTGQIFTPLSITVGTNPPVAWGGLNLQGRPVGAGSYTVEVMSVQPGGAPLVVNKTIEVVASNVGRPVTAVLVVPDPWRGQGPLEVVYTPSFGDYGAGTIYNLAGQEVASASDGSDSGVLSFNPTRLSSGIYLLEFRQMGGTALLARGISKFAVVR